jgi:hypothetical protein
VCVACGASKNCIRYLCADDDMIDTFYPNQCSYYDEGIGAYYLSGCENGTACENRSGRNSTCTARPPIDPTDGSKYPGETCTGVNECISNVICN